MISSQMLGIIVLNDFVLVVCTKNFSFGPPGGLLCLKPPLSQNSLKLVILSYIFETAPQIFLIFALSLAHAERPQHCALVGLSALAEEAYGITLVRPCVRACVRHSISGDPRIRFFRNFAPSCFLARLKKCSKRIFEKNSRLPPRGGFVLKNPPF